MKIISLTSIPSRFKAIGSTLECLLGQNADQVLLHIPYRYKRFPDWNGDLPRVPEGIQIVRCDHDYGPATKILPAVKALEGLNVQVLFCDDDCIVPAGWANRLFSIQAKRRNEAVAVYTRPACRQRAKSLRFKHAWQVPIRYDIPYRTSRLIHKLIGTQPLYRRPFWFPGHGDIFFGVCGVVIRPDFFDNVVFDIPDTCWPVDDIWLSAMLARKQIPIYCPMFGLFPKSHEASVCDALAEAEFDGQRRAELNTAAIEYCRNHFNIW